MHPMDATKKGGKIMNKYEKALEDLLNEVMYDSDVSKSFILIKELVERATLKKSPEVNENIHAFVCPSCETWIDCTGEFKDHKHCLDCGQALDWSEENE